jgi:CheY-like chemotaxis protein
VADILELKEEASSFSILYAEDNDALREKAGKLLSKVFSKVCKASNGEEAIELFKNHTPPIVITDINMPKLDGMELSKHIHKTHPDTRGYKRCLYKYFR